MRSSNNDTLLFFRKFVERPGKIGAVAPSSRSLCREIVRSARLDTAQGVVEYGPGTGVVTELLRQAVPTDCRLFAIEVDPTLAEGLQARFPDVTVYRDSVSNVSTLCSREGLRQLDCVVSGLPWASFSEEDQARYLDATVAVLKPGGQFLTFAYVHGTWLPPGRRFRQKLSRYFSEVVRSRVVWKNLPPAYVYVCRR
jgi:phosphatidylethanolamine/phosphatidyl-N-methylethanolamine N-methyltransferase